MHSRDLPMHSFIEIYAVILLGASAQRKFLWKLLCTCVLVLSSANFSLRGCRNNASWFPLATCACLMQSLRQKFALQSGFTFAHAPVRHRMRASLITATLFSSSLGRCACGVHTNRLQNTIIHHLFHHLHRNPLDASV